jgi:hypothetical protein
LIVLLSPSPIAQYLLVQGAVYVFHRDIFTFQWKQEQKIYSQIPVSGDQYGFAVAMNQFFVCISLPYRQLSNARQQTVSDSCLGIRGFLQCHFAFALKCFHCFSPTCTMLCFSAGCHRRVPANLHVCQDRFIRPRVHDYVVLRYCSDERPHWSFNFNVKEHAGGGRAK